MTHYIKSVQQGETVIDVGLSSEVKDNIFSEFISRLSQVPVLEHKCNSCGGTLEMNADQHIFKCPYCGSVYAIGTNHIYG